MLEFSDSKVAQYRKFLAALVPLVGVLASQGLLSGTAEAITNAVLAAVGAFLVATVKNALPLDAKPGL